jgi:hypothetical protein
MTGGSGPKDAPHPFTDEARALGIDVDNPHALAWMEKHLPEYRQQASGQRPLYWILGIGFVVGLAAHVGGYLLRPSPPTEPLGLVADLLYALGFALWTGVVVVFFVQIWPEAKRRQLKRALDAYEAALRQKGRAGSGHEGGRERGRQPEQHQVDPDGQRDQAAGPAELLLQRHHEHPWRGPEAGRAQKGHESYPGGDPRRVQPSPPGGGDHGRTSWIA